MNHVTNKFFAGYIPVVHAGYLSLLEKHTDCHIRVFDSSIIANYDYLRKDIRALSPQQSVDVLVGIGYGVSTISNTELQAILEDKGAEICLLDDDISRAAVSGIRTVRARLKYESPFLRWDRRSTNIDVAIQADRVADDLGEMVERLYSAAEKSTDWWRSVGAALKDAKGNIHESYNHSMPHPYINSIEGDPRITGHRGESIEKSVFIHAEASIIAQLAHKGVSSAGGELYVTTFPCPNCAKLIAASGIKTCYFIENYATADGERVLRAAGVELVQIIADAPSPNVSRLRPYPEHHP